MERLEIQNAADRDTVAQILFRNGYTVKLSKSVPNGKTRNKTYLEYEKEEETR